MNPIPDGAFWLRTLGVPALQVLALLAVVGLGVPRLRSARSQRAAWLATFAASGLLLLGGLVGADRQLATWLGSKPASERTFRVRTNLPVDGSPAALYADAAFSAAASGGSIAPSVEDAEAKPGPVWWPAWLWLAGVVAVAAHRLVLRGMFASWWRRRQAPAPSETRAQVESVARRLGLRGRVRVIEFPALVGPIAFGILKPTVGLPAGFTQAHAEREREAMLAHELAHLSARDPLWLTLADAVAAVLWWLPGVWWARRRLRSACEAAADEASLLVEDGPAVLADCLVTLAARLPRRGAFGLLGMAGFRSDLGRRVERLLELRARPFPPSRLGRFLLKVSGGVLLAVALGVVSAAWALPDEAREQPSLLALARVAWLTPGSSAEEPLGTAKADGASGSATAREPEGDVNAAGDPAVPSDPGNEIVLRVQLAAVDPAERESMIRICMDALTRRLYATDQFSRVQCEPVASGIRIRLRFKDGSELPAARDSNDRRAWLEFVGGLKTLVESRGEIEFRRVHPESDELVREGQCPQGFEVLTEKAADDPRPGGYVVERAAALGPTGRHVETAAVVQDPSAAEPRVSVKFTEEGTRLFSALTRDAVGQRIAVVVDGEVLMAPRVNEPILGGRCEISGRFSKAEAGRLAALLQHPLPASLKLAEMNWGEPTADAPASGPVGLPSQPDPGSQTVSVRPAAGAEASVATLVQDGKLLYEMGKLEEAKSKLEEALRQRPDSPAATYYLRLIRDSEAQRARLLRPPAEPARRLPMPLVTRTYRLDPNLVTEGIENLLGQAATNRSPGEALRRLFTSAGVDFGETNALTRGASNTAQPRGFDGVLGGRPLTIPATNANGFMSPAGRALFYNDRSGVLLVRATMEDLEVIEQLVQLLNESLPQVTIEAKFVEITQEDSKALGFDWFLGNVPNGGGTNVNTVNPGSAPAAGVFPAAPGAADPTAVNSTGPPATVTGILTDPQFRSVVSALSARSTNSNGLRELRGDQLDWAGREATNAQNIRISAALDATLTGILTDAQYRTVLKALEQRSGVEILAAPKVTTLSGRQAQIQIVDLQTIASGINPASLVQPGAAPGTNTVPFVTSSVPVGPSLDVLPTVAADGYSIQLMVLPTVTEFLGYDEPPEGGKTRVWEDGKEKWVALPLPRFRVRQMQTHALVWDGQTLVLGGLPVDVLRTLKDKVPVLGDLPAVGGLFRSESKQNVKKNLIVFVTATIVDPAGNRVHSADNLPFDPHTVPVPGLPKARVEAR